MWSDAGVNHWVALPAFQKSFAVSGHFCFSLVVRGGKVNPGFAEDTAHPSSFGFFGDRIFKIVHIGERRDAAANLLGCGEARAPADVFLGHVLGFSGEDVFVEPVVERDVVMQAAHQGHGDVCVTVDEARKDEFAGGVDGLWRLELGCDFRASTHGENRVALNRNGPALLDCFDCCDP